jgi:hypothetical protein
MRLIFILLFFLVNFGLAPPKKAHTSTQSFSIHTFTNDAKNIKYPKHKTDLLDMDSPAKDYIEAPVVIFLDNHSQSRQVKSDIFLRNGFSVEQRHIHKNEILGLCFMSSY